MDTPSDGRNSYRLAVFAAPDDLKELAAILGRVLGMHPTDAMVHARLAPGFLCDRLSAETANQLANEVRRSGIHALAVDGASLPPLDHAPVIHHARCLDEGLEILGLHGTREQLVPWPDLRLISLGDIPQEATRRYQMADMSAVTSARRSLPGSMLVPISPGPEVWLVCRHPDRGYRIDHKRMNYESLGLRKSDSATANIRLFLDDLISHAPQAYLAPATRSYVEHGSADARVFRDAAELRDATLLHWLVNQEREGIGPGAAPRGD